MNTETPWIAANGKDPGLPPMTFVFARYPGELREQVEAANGGYGEAARTVNWPEVAEYRLKHPATTERYGHDNHTFDPAAWLAAFSEAGGCYVVSIERSAFFVRDAENPRFMEAKRMCDDLDDDELFDAISALVRERSLIA